MPFLNPPSVKSDQVPPEGPIDAKIAIIGEAPGGYEERAGRPFVGPSGNMLNTCMQSAGMIRRECYLTNVLKHRPGLNSNNFAPYYNTRKGEFTEKGKPYVHALHEELMQCGANVFVPLGNPAFTALTGKAQITKHRGYVFESTLLEGRKVIPSLHPAAIMRGKHIERYYLAKDLSRAVRESEYPEIRRPERQLIYDLDYIEACEWLDAFNAQKIVCFDIEVINFEVSCIGFTSSPNFAVTIPFYECWDEHEERELWRRIAKIMENPKVAKAGQNLMFDTAFLLQQNRIRTRGPILDTMIMHSLIYPDMLKGLEFLASIYCECPEYWKDLAEFKNIKEED